MSEYPPVLPPVPTGPEPRRRPRIVDAIIEIVTTVVLAVILYLVIQTFIVQTFRVEQESMMTTLEPGQHLLIDKLTPRFDDYSRGDVVVFHPPTDASMDGTPYIKRVIGVAGDHIEVKDEHAWVNGVQLTEPYVAGYPTEPTGGETEWDVPAGEIFVMGDHRDHSVDSRAFGTVPVGNVIGRAVIRFWPIGTLGILQTPTYPDVPAAPPAS